MIELRVTNEAGSVTLRAKDTPRPYVWELTPGQVRSARRRLAAGGAYSVRPSRARLEFRGDGGAWVIMT